MSNVIELMPEAEAAELVRPCYRVYDHPITLGGEKLRPGVWFHGIRRDGEGAEVPADEWLCGPLHVDAVTRAEGNGADYGRLLRFRNLDNRELSWAMPGELLAGRPEGILSVLFGMGLEIDYQRRAQVPRYIASQHPRQRVTAATATGWHGPELFITPTGNIGKGDAIYQAESAADGDYSKAGTLDGWCETVGALLPGNPLLQLGIGTALAGPLLYHLGIHTGGGFHLLWDSSNGKTTVVQCAASAWGHGAYFALKWNATANGLEGIAAVRNDCLLALDELGQADPRYVGDVVYSVADGIGKQRAGRSSAARKVRRWRVMMLSSGEITLETKMAEAGKRVRAGQEVRLVTVSAGRAFGAWDNLHSHPNGASLSDALKKASTTHYGHAGPAFVLALIDSGELGDLPAMLEKIKAHFNAEPGQPERVAERFAIVALALELAAGLGVLPLEKNEGIRSMVELFNGWRAGRGEGPSEDHQILKAIADFIDRHGGSRFQSVEAGADEVRDRAGYWEDRQQGGRLYLFTSGGLEEATKGFDLPRVVRALDSVGAIAKKEHGKHQHKKRLPDGSTPRLYWIDLSRLEPDG
ncbi:DUF927 domain-containing protein [Azotobacter chroococcum]|uniref:DUF927 domain-containing protein n=1 Tax=Azotobacter chroococcum TaxID=353 RepID=UPI0010AE79A0|nr:DUF927 domain-containing protein [Azotobacter chroococcum]TKD44224.1 DUF927 domain-containing protein [Azotobacter chroococcum]